MAKRGADGDATAGVQSDKGSAFALPTGPAVLGKAAGDEALHGSWDSGKGKCCIGKDPITARLCYEEPLEDGQRLHGWLDAVKGEESLWQGTLAILEKGKGPWYGPSFGPAPEVVGDIRVRLVSASPPSMETQIRVADEDEDWQPAVAFSLASGDKAVKMMPRSSLPTATDSAPTFQKADDEEEEKEQGDRKRTKR
mmetsp:Transcript_103521/g.183615  ORF Transcript_103521/g.183615 Transcript_103521/m.183615 type:complete len:196 (+) Transcript_103521:102-689(+)